MGDLEELLQILQVDAVDRMDPDGSLKSVTLQIFQFLQQIDSNGGFLMFLNLLKVVDGSVIDEIVPQEYLLNAGLVAGELVVQVGGTHIGDIVEPQTQHLEHWIFISNDGVNNLLHTLVSDPVVTQFKAL